MYKKYKVKAILKYKTMRKKLKKLKEFLALWSEWCNGFDSEIRGELERRDTPQQRRS